MKKKIIAALLISALAVSVAACGGEKKPEETKASTTAAGTSAADNGTEATGASESAPAADVMTYDQFKAAALESKVIVETCVQAKQGWWEKEGVGVATFYTQADDHSAYFIYEMPCSKEEYDKLTPGTKIRVTGFKAEWAGEVEIMDASYEIIDGQFIAQPEDVTALLGKDELADHMNERVAFKGLTIEARTDKDGGEHAFFYSYDNSGEDGSDLYFDASLDGNKYTFTVESYLCGPDTDVYKTVKELNIGDVIDMEGFLYWYNGANPHITSVSVVSKAEASGNAAMSYADYASAELDTQVTVETYIQAKQDWWENNGVGNASFYTQTDEGGYFLYNMPCTKEEYEQLAVGTKIRVTGYKAAWAGEVEITDGKFEILDGSYIAEPTDVTALLGSDGLENYMNRFVSFKGMTVAAKTDADGNEHAFFYSYDNSGEDGADLYFDVELGGNTYTFTVESYLCGVGTAVYNSVKELKVGDKIDLEGFLYWYEGANPHITSVKAAE